MIHRPLAPKRIALFSGAYNHIADGVTLTLNRLVKHLESNGIEVRIFAPTTNTPAIDHAGTLVAAPSVRMPLPGRAEYRVSTHFPRYIREELERFNPSIIHLATPDALGKGALNFALKRKIPVVASYHTHFSSYLQYYKLQWLESWMWNYLRRFYAQCDQVYVPSESMMQVLRSHKIESNLYLWERGVETTLFNPSRRSLEWRRKRGIGDDEVVVSFISRLVWEKGLDIYADVIERLEANGIPHRSLIVGKGPAGDELKSRLKNTIFLGHLKGEELATAYASSDLFLFPSETETFGNVTLEAMASGLPTVCADATGSSSLVRDGVTGYLAAPQDASSFYPFVEKLAVEGMLRREMGALALKRAKEFDWSVILDRIMGYYNALLQRRPIYEDDGVMA